jgi:hypothetical protein
MPASTGVNVTVWTFLAAVRPVPGVYCSFVAYSLPPQYTVIEGLAQYIGAAPSKTELQQCQSLWTVCNGPIALTRIAPAAQPVSVMVDVNYNKDTGMNTNTFSVSGPQYLTATTATVLDFNGGTHVLTFLSIAPGDANGNPLGVQQGIDFLGTIAGTVSQVIGIQVTVTTNNLAGFPVGTALGTNYCAFVGRPDTPCAILTLVPTPGSCYFFPAGIIGPPPVEIADCETCSDCACDDPIAERGDGSLCCPPFFMGYQCATNTHTDCTTTEIASLCSGNGNATFPGNVNGTGCFPTDDGFECSCLHEYAPPHCLLRFDTACGYPLCSNHGNCSDPSGIAIDAFACYCEAGYRGNHCQYPVAQCFVSLDDLACSGHGSCEDPDSEGFGTPVCICDDGYTGMFCEESLFVSCVDPVSSTVCDSTGMCIPTQPCTLPFPAAWVTQPGNQTIAFQAFASYVILASGDVQNTGPSVVNGNIGLAPGFTASGFDQGTWNGVNVTIPSLVLLVSQQLSILAGLPCTRTLGDTSISGTFTAGVYCFTNAVSFTFAITLDAQLNARAVFVFRLMQAISVDSTAQFILLNGAVPQNVYITASNIQFQPGSSAVGTWVGALISANQATVTGLLVGSTVTIVDSIVTAPLPVSTDSCSVGATSFDVCNSTGLFDFCATRIGDGKRLDLGSPAYIYQTFTLPELECLNSNFSAARGFAILTNLQNFCIVELQITLEYFMGAPSQFDKAYLCTTALQRAGNVVRLYIPSLQSSYVINELCYSTELVSGVPALAGAVREAFVTYVRVGQTPLSPIDAHRQILSQCQLLAQSSGAPYYGVDTSVSRCWIPAVPSGIPSTPPSAAMAIFPDFIYSQDTHNPDAVQFWFALTSSIPD